MDPFVSQQSRVQWYDTNIFSGECNQPLRLWSERACLRQPIPITRFSCVASLYSLQNALYIKHVTSAKLYIVFLRLSRQINTHTHTIASDISRKDKKRKRIDISCQLENYYAWHCVIDVNEAINARDSSRRRDPGTNPRLIVVKNEEKSSRASLNKWKISSPSPFPYYSLYPASKGGNIFALGILSLSDTSQCRGRHRPPEPTWSMEIT